MNVKCLIDAIFVTARIIILLLLQLRKTSESLPTSIYGHESQLMLDLVNAKRGLCPSMDPNELSSFQCTYMFHGICASCPMSVLLD